MACKCQDTLSKKCRWELPSDEMLAYLRPERSMSRTQRKAAVRRMVDEALAVDDSTPFFQWESAPSQYIVDDEQVDCYCRRCLLHDDPANCLVRFPVEAS